MNCAVRVTHPPMNPRNLSPPPRLPPHPCLPACLSSDYTELSQHLQAKGLATRVVQVGVWVLGGGLHCLRQCKQTVVVGLLQERGSLSVCLVSHQQLLSGTHTAHLHTAVSSPMHIRPTTPNTDWSCRLGPQCLSPDRCELVEGNTQAQASHR